MPALKLIDLDDIQGLPPLGPFANHKALAVKRFDRGEGEKKIHIEDFAQVYGVFPEKKYSGVSYNNIAQMLYSVCGESALVEFVRRLIFNAFIGNADMHLKNWPLIYKDPRQPQLAPAYDFVATVVYLDDTNMALGLCRAKSMYEYNIALFKCFARKF